SGQGYLDESIRPLCHIPAARNAVGTHFPVALEKYRLARRSRSCHALAIWEASTVRRMIVARRVRHKQDPLSQILDKVTQRLGSSPLSCICGKVEEVVLMLQQDLQH